MVRTPEKRCICGQCKYQDSQPLNSYWILTELTTLDTWRSLLCWPQLWNDDQTDKCQLFLPIFLLFSWVIKFFVIVFIHKILQRYVPETEKKADKTQRTKRLKTVESLSRSEEQLSRLVSKQLRLSHPTSHIQIQDWKSININLNHWFRWLGLVIDVKSNNII